MAQPLVRLVVLASLSLAARAQTGAPLPTTLDTWRELHGASWTAEYDPQSGALRSLYGGHTEPGAHLYTNAAAFARARAILAATSAFARIDPATLENDEAVFLPLSSAGSSDKYTARFRQVAHGLPVIGASVNVLMDLEGRGLSIETTAIPGAAAVSTTAIHAASAAEAQALRSFTSIAKTAGTVVSVPTLVLDRVTDRSGVHAALAWEIDVLGEGDHGVPRGLRLRLLDSNLSLSSQEELVHTCDVTGTVFTRLTPGVLPDTAANPTVVSPLAHIVVTSPQGNATTDAAGNFTIVGASAPLNVTVKYDGPFTTTTNNATAVYSLVSNLTLPTGNQVNMNSPANPLYTAEANSAYWIGRMRDWTRAVNPTDGTGDFDALSHVNLAQTCNAYFDGSSVNFFAPGGGCPNTAYSTVVLHETGHWYNVRYNSGNGGDGFGEGNADDFATYITDQPIVGQDFFGVGANIRTGLNTRQFCGDQNGGCYGEVHNDGEVLMGALWKVRARLKASLGAGAGAATADLLFNGWMNAYDDGQIKTIDRTHWLVLDDNDGDINNGTPHFNDINNGYHDQGFPLFVLTPVALSNLTVLPNTTDEVGPYVVSVHGVANITPPLSQPQLFWRVNNGAYTAVGMSSLGGNNYQASIPGQISPAKVEYYVSATDAANVAGFAPVGAPATTDRFVVGDERVYFSDSFDTPVSFWAAGAISGVNDWQFNLPQGLGGDPNMPRTGLKCWGTDLGNQGFDGLYSANSSSWVESPVIDLQTCPRPLLRFQRWLTVESAIHDQARVLVNGQVVWQNSSGGDTIDLGWTETEVDLTPYAAGNPNTRVRFQITTDGAVQKGGWNIDDVQIVMDSAVGQGCIDPITYCTAKLTSTGTLPKLSATGAASASLSTLQVELRDASSNKAGLLLRSTTGQNSAPFLGGTLCIQTPIVRQNPYTTDVFGYATLPIPVTPAMIGVTWNVQAWFRDPPSSFGVGLSDALQIKFCP